jgi:hypothetical protein
MTSKARRATIDEVMAWGPCAPPDGPYTREYVKRLFGRYKYMTVERILDLDIPDEDKIWAASRLVSERVACEFALACERRALTRKRRAGREPDKRSWDALRVVRRWLDDEASDEELYAARAAEYAASAGALAACTAEYAAQVQELADVLGRAPAGPSQASLHTLLAAHRLTDGATDAAGAAAYAAERKWQVDWLRRAVKEGVL